MQRHPRVHFRGINHLALIADTSALFAGADRSEPEHQACLDLIATQRSDIVIPQLVVAELGYFLGTRLGARTEHLFAASIAAQEFHVEPVHSADWVRIADLTREYADLPLGIVDASVVAVAERLGDGRLLTLDRKHFQVVRPSHIGAFELLPR